MANYDCPNCYGIGTIQWGHGISSLCRDCLGTGDWRQGMSARVTPPIGTHGNAWLAADVGAATYSAGVDTLNAPFVSAFGNTSGASTITVSVSMDASTWYDTTITFAANGDFWFNFSVGVRYVRLKSSAHVTITATIAAKG